MTNKILDAFLKQYIENRIFREHHIYGDAKRLHLAKTANVNNGFFNLASGNITIGDYVFFGHNVTLITGTHDYNKFDLQRQTSIPASGNDITIKRGAWISSNATVLGPCVIGEHAVVAAGSVVIHDIEPYTIVAGIPARPVKTIQPPAGLRS
jgi:acetyltransferase-like isoleucine patch superfamily enzyme